MPRKKADYPDWVMKFKKMPGNDTHDNNLSVFVVFSDSRSLQIF